MNNCPICIKQCRGREILDSRGKPTVLATVTLQDGTEGVAAVPSGASTGIYEAHERRDFDPARHHGKGTRGAAAEIDGRIANALCGVRADDQYAIDRIMCDLDGSPNKSTLGANATLAVSLACARAAAAHYRLPLWRYLGGARARRLPIPMMNVLNGGAHAGNNIEIQEFMIVPVGAPSFSEALRMGAEIYQTLGTMLRSEGYATTVGDEGGFAPDLASDDMALDFLCRAIGEAGYSTEQVKISLDAAASEWMRDMVEGEGAKTHLYVRPKRGETFTADALTEEWQRIAHHYPLLSLEDGLDQRDFDGWTRLTERLGESTMLVGDDLFVTNSDRLREGIKRGAANAILIKPNQIGTLTETLEVIALAQAAGYTTVMSHRSGETEDTTIADLAVATGCPFIKAGAPCRSERVAKYNRLLAIEDHLGAAAQYGL